MFTCLMRAIAGQRLLARHGIESGIVLGVQLDPSGAAPKAHAWLRVGQYVITGGEERAGYHAVTELRLPQPNGNKPVVDP